MHCSIPSITLSVGYACQGPLRMPPFSGSLLRGVLGPALRDICCFSRRLKCHECILKERCLYPLCFEDVTAGEKGRRSPPRPFVFQLPWETEPRRYGHGDALGFSMTLFDHTVWERLPYLAAALYRLGQRGLGRERIPLVLQSIDVMSPSGHTFTRIYEEERLHQPPEPEPWPDEAFALAPEAHADVEMEFITPLILKRHGRHFDS